MSAGDSGSAKDGVPGCVELLTVKSLSRMILERPTLKRRTLLSE
jgi:hypothetical protein